MPYIRILVFLTALFLALPSPGAADAVEGRKVFEAKRCGECHETSGPTRDRTFQDVLGRKGPELWYSGSKFKAGFLVSWLKNPVPIRPMRYYSLTEKNPGDHPRLSPDEAGSVAGYLMSLTSPLVRDAGINKNLVPRGRVAFIKKQACYGCHLVTSREKVVGGVTGPSLVGAAKRLNPNWVYAYLSNSKTFKPVKDMPEYRGVVPDAEMKAIAAYINTFE